VKRYRAVFHLTENERPFSRLETEYLPNRPRRRGSAGLPCRERGTPPGEEDGRRKQKGAGRAAESSPPIPVKRSCGR